MPKWWHVNGKRLSRALLIVFLTPLLLGILAILVQGQLAPWRFVRILSNMDPEINLVPTALPDTSVAILSGERVEHFGFSIQLPWKEIDHDRTLKDVAILSSKNYDTMTIWNPSSSLFSNAWIHRSANFVPAPNHRSLRSNYALASAAMASKTEQMKWWKTPSQNAKILNRLLMKLRIQNGCHGVPYLVSFGEVRGFQQGSPSVAPYCVKLDLFDSTGINYVVTIARADGRPVISQAEINAIVASLHPISH